jgi:hypothetical protein
MRHLEMDALVDMAWFLNKDIAHELLSAKVGEKLAAVDTFCYEQTHQQLRAWLDGGKLKLYLFQTGFQPAIIGFYRALVEELLERIGAPPALEVTPFYFIRAKGHYGPGQKSWH